jgi:hypothetical protein
VDDRISIDVLDTGREAATPDRAVVVGGLGETPRNCDDDTIVTARGNEIRSLRLMSALRVNSGTCGQ